jgi:predicted protein tyrosine phosphatase
MFRIERAGPGELSTMARPRGNEWLADEMSALRDAGVHVVVSMLTEAEEIERELGGEADAALAAGLEFISRPTPDRGVPDAKAFRSVLTQLDAILRDGRHMVIHCPMGIGRASMRATGLRISEGMTAVESWSAIGAARGMPGTGHRTTTVMAGERRRPAIVLAPIAGQKRPLREYAITMSVSKIALRTNNWRTFV